MDTLHFDVELAASALLWTLLTVAVTVLPLFASFRERSALSMLRGGILALLGSLLLLRTDAAFAVSVQELLPGLPTRLTPVVLTALIGVIWSGSWSVVLPAIGNRLTNAGPLATLAWSIATLVLVYVVVLIIGGLPGALATGLAGKTQERQAMLESHQQRLQRVRDANAVSVCLRLSELQRANSTQLLSSAQRWGVAMDNPIACAAKAAAMPLAQVKALFAELHSAVRRPERLKLTPVEWKAEPEVPPMPPSSLGQLCLDEFFTRAIFKPIEHVRHVISDLDLALTFLLLGEGAATVLWGLDVLLRRGQVPAAPGLDDFSLADH